MEPYPTEGKEIHGQKSGIYPGIKLRSLRAFSAARSCSSASLRFSSSLSMAAITSPSSRSNPWAWARVIKDSRSRGASASRRRLSSSGRCRANARNLSSWSSVMPRTRSIDDDDPKRKSFIATAGVAKYAEVVVAKRREPMTELAGALDQGCLPMFEKQAWRSLANQSDLLRDLAEPGRGAKVGKRAGSLQVHGIRHLQAEDWKPYPWSHNP